MSFRARLSLAVLAAAGLTLMLLAPQVVFLALGGVLVAILLRSGSDPVERGTSLSRGWALAFVLGLGAALLTAIGLLAAPFVADQFAQLGRALPEAARRLDDRLQDVAWLDPVIARIGTGQLLPSNSTMAQIAGSATSATLGFIGSVVVVAFLGVYFAADSERYRRGILAFLAPSCRAGADPLLTELGTTLRAWLLAQLVSMSMVGLLTGLGLWMLGIPLALGLGLIAAVLTFVPNLGPILSAVPAILLALSSGGQVVLAVIMLYVAVQTVESYFMTPLLQEQAVDLPPGLLFLAQLLFGLLYGLPGLMLAAPLVAVLRVLMLRLYIERFLGREMRERDEMLAGQSAADDLADS